MATSLVLRRDLELVRSLSDAAGAGTVLDDAFSRKGSFRKRAKRAAMAAAEDVVLEAAVRKDEEKKVVIKE